MEDLGVTLPPVPPRAGLYVPAVRTFGLRVVNGASPLLLDIFGEAGEHARCAVGTSSLPSDIAVEIEMAVEARDA